MRVVLDPNVLISALISPAGHSAQIVSAWIEERSELVVSGVARDDSTSARRRSRREDVGSVGRASRTLSPDLKYPAAEQQKPRK
jgi:hypothetical protein